jgi:hypothetical protein
MPRLSIPFFLCQCILGLMIAPSTLFAQTRPSAHVVTPAQIRKKIEQNRKLPDDPVAAVRRLLALPPMTTQSASFFGNQTAITATPANAFLMVRETNCSLTAFNAAYSLNSSSADYTQQSRTYNYDQTIHTASGLTTTPGQFGGKCKDPGIGTTANSLTYVGLTTTGMRVGALAGYNGNVGYNQLFTIVSKTDGTSPVTATLAPPSIAGNNPLFAIAGDINKDGNNDIVSLNYGSASANSPVTSSVTVYLARPDGSFDSGTSYLLPGDFAYGGAVIDDFNGDGNLDIVVPIEVTIGSGNFQIAFLPGKGDGTFGAAKTTSLAGAVASPNNLVSGDFNNDGKKDLISGFGLVLLGKGDGTFTPQTTLAFPTLNTNSSAGPQLAVGDFNKDGKLDFAAGTGEAIAVYLGKGDGTFTHGNTYASIENHGYLAAADLDGDGNLDLYSGDAANGIFGGDDFTPNMGYALMGNGDGTFRGAPTTNQAQSLEDLNGDGKLDYLTLSVPLNAGTSTFQAFLGRGDGTFTAGPTLAISPFTYNGTPYNLTVDSYTILDVNGDGKPDLIVLPTTGFQMPNSYYRLALMVALGNGDGSFQTPTIVPFPSLIPSGGTDNPYQVTGLVLGKRANGKSELIYQFISGDSAAPNNTYTGVATQVVNGDGTFATPVLTLTATYASNVTGLTVNAPINALDANGDKTTDLVYYTQPVTTFINGNPVVTTPATFQLSLGNADGTFQTPKAINVTDNPAFQPLTTADVNNDGKLDLIALGTSSSYYGEIGVALGNGDGTFQTPVNIPLEESGNGFESLAAADFDGDGKVDITILGYDPPTDSGVFLGNGDGTFQSVPSGNSDGRVIPQQPLYLIAYGNAFAVDINGDGKPDIFGSAVLINQYGSAVTPPPPTLTGSTTSLSAAPTSITVGQSVTLTATVAPASGATIPTGSVTFSDGATTLGTGSLNAQGVAMLSTSTLAAGVQSITANYGGNTSFSGSTSSAISVTVNSGSAKTNSTTVLTASPAAATAGQTVTFTATVTAASGSAIPTGTITFLNGSATLGTGTLNGMGVATLSSSALPAGTLSITASYGGDTNFNSSTSTAATVTITAATTGDFNLSLSSSSATVTSGSSTQTTLTLMPTAGFSGTVTLSCTGNPKHTTCNFNPSTVTLDGSSGTSALTIQTNGQTAELWHPSNLPTPLSRGNARILGAISVSSLFGLVFFRRRNLVCRLTLLLIISGIALTVTGCGSSSKAQAGTYTINVVATSGALSHTSTFNLTVK